MMVAQLSPNAKTLNTYNNIPNIADIRTRIIADINVREAENLQSSQAIGVFADIRTTPPLRGDALSAIPHRAEKRATLRAALGQSSSQLLEHSRSPLGRLT